MRLDGDSGTALGGRPKDFRPFALAVDADGLLYVCDFHGHSIVVLSISGAAVTVMRTLGSRGTGPGQLRFPCDVCVDEQGNVLVADLWNKRVVVYARDGTATHLELPGKTKGGAVASGRRLAVR